MDLRHSQEYLQLERSDTPYKQVVILAGQGAIAALSAYSYLQKLKGRPAVRGDWKTIVKES